MAVVLGGDRIVMGSATEKSIGIAAAELCALGRQLNDSVARSESCASGGLMFLLRGSAAALVRQSVAGTLVPHLVGAVPVPVRLSAGAVGGGRLGAEHPGAAGPGG